MKQIHIIHKLSFVGPIDVPGPGHYLKLEILSDQMYYTASTSTMYYIGTKVANKRNLHGLV